MLTGYIRKAPCSLLPTYGRPRLIAIIVRPYHQMSLSFKKTAQCWITAYNKAAGVFSNIMPGAGRKRKRELVCPWRCKRKVPHPDSKDDTCFQMTDPENSDFVYHKKVYCPRCEKSFFCCHRCFRVSKQRFYSHMKGDCTCNNLDRGTDNSSSVGGEFDIAEDADGNDTVRFNSTSDINLDDAPVSAVSVHQYLRAFCSMMTPPPCIHLPRYRPR